MSNPPTQLALEVKNLTRRFGDRTILDHLSFKLMPGETLVIMGGSGCGKSTLLKLIYGLYDLEEGHIFWNNIEVWIKEASWLTVPELIRDIYSKGGYLAYALKSHDQEWTLEVLQTFMAFAIRMSEKTPFMKPHEFIATVKKMINNDITVPLEKRIGTAIENQLNGNAFNCL